MVLGVVPQSDLSSTIILTFFLRLTKIKSNRNFYTRDRKFNATKTKSLYLSAVACPEKLGRKAQSNFPTRDHQNIFSLILFFICFGKYLPICFSCWGVVKHSFIFIHCYTKYIHIYVNQTKPAVVLTETCALCFQTSFRTL